MSKKQIRISGADEVKKRLPTLANQRVNLVLRDNTVVFGVLREIGSDHVIMRNMRNKKMRLPVDAIVDAYTDIDS